MTPEQRPMLHLPGISVPAAPSVHTVLKAIGEHQPMTNADLQARTGLPRRTVYAALRTLRGLDVLKERPSLRDMRQIFVSLANHLQPSKMCGDCPFQTNGQAVEVLPPERHDRLAMLAASGVPVQCHSAMDPNLAMRAKAEGADWRLDHEVTRPCAGIPKAAR